MNNNIHVLVLEDDAAESAALVQVLTENNFTVSGVAASHAEALVLLQEHKTDVAIIDIFLNGHPDGISFAETISLTPELVLPFVFLTASRNREVFDRARLTRPFSYLVKPYNELELCYAIEMAVERFYGQNGAFSSRRTDMVMGSDSFFIRKKNALKKVNTSDMLYIEVEERYCHIVTAEEKFVVQISLSRVMELLDKNRFIRTHRKYLVNSEKISEIVLADNLILLKGGQHIPFSDHYREFLYRFVVLK